MIATPSSGHRHFHDHRPTTSEGDWSLRLVGGGLALTAAIIALVAVTGLRADIGPVSLFGVSALIGLASVIAGGVFAIVAVLRRNERSAFVLATLPVSTLALFLVVGELAVPH